MDEKLLSRRAAGGDLDSFGQLYDQYFHRVYDFAWRVLRDSNEAAAATQETFAAATRSLASLAQAPGFRAWIFGIAHRAVIARADVLGDRGPAAGHEEAFGAFDVPDPCRLEDASVVDGDNELAPLVWEAVAVLNARDYALLDLHVRQELDATDIAHVLSMNKRDAQTLLDRMKMVADDAIGGYVVARRGGSACPVLARLLSEHGFPPYTEDVRRAVESHLRECDVCGRTRAGMAAPVAVFGSFSAAPAAFAVKGRTWADIAASWPYTSRGFADDAMGQPLPPPMEPAGAGAGGIIGAPPVGFDEEDSFRSRVVLFGGAVAALLIVAFGAAVLAAQVLGGDGSGASGGGRTPSANGETAQTTTTPGADVDTPTPDTTASVTATPTEEGDETPTVEPPTAAPPPPTEPPAVTPTPEPPEATATTPPQPGVSPTRTPLIPIPR